LSKFIGFFVINFVVIRHVWGGGEQFFRS